MSQNLVADSPPTSYCNSYTAHWGAGSASGCANGTRSEPWCSDFAAEAWQQAGVSFTYGKDLTAASSSFYRWGLAHGTWHPAGSGYVPQPGDAVLFGTPSSAAHVGIFVSGTATSPNIVNGDMWRSSGVDEVYYWTGQTTNGGGAPLSGFVSIPSNSSAVVPGGTDLGYSLAFQANTSSLWTVGQNGHGAWNLGLMEGTSPSITTLASGATEVAFQANTGSLWTVGSDGHGAWNLGMMPGTSPAIARLAGGGYEVAFQANTGSLWTAGSAGTRNWGLGMAPGTSPTITGLSNGGYELAFQANTGNLWTAGSAGTGDWHLGMAGGTSPSITDLSNGGYEVAFQANTGSLWTVGSDSHGSWGLGMAPSTSPTIG